MAQLKFEAEKAQLETVLGQQMSIYQSNMQSAMADNIITPQESQQLMGNLDSIQQVMAQLQGLQAQAAMQANQPSGAAPLTPEQFGIDRHRIMGIPIGPKLTLNTPIPTKTQSAQSSEKNSLDLSPSGAEPVEPKSE